MLSGPSESSIAIGFVLLWLLLVLVVLAAVAVVVALALRSRGHRGMKGPQDKNVPIGVPPAGPVVGSPGQRGLPGDAAGLMRLGLASQPVQTTPPTSAGTQQLRAADTPTAQEADETAPAADHLGGPFVPPNVEELQRLLPQFQILELLGRGGMGAVYKARQISLDRIVALKILPLQVVQSAGFAERFTREARALARLNHQNVVAVHDFGQTNGIYYIVMEFVDGTNIRQMIRAGNLKPEEAMAIVPQICEALQFAHNEGIVHRDIKPENILLDKRGRVKIADFGLAKLMEPGSVDYTLTAASGTMGTPHYMAPEQIGKSHAVDHRADIYSLGVVFYEMLTGELPIGRFAAPSKMVQIDVRLDEVVLKALEREPEKRYQHASEVQTSVELVRNTPSPAGPVTAQGLAKEVGAAGPAVPPPQLSRLAIFGAICGGAIVLAVPVSLFSMYLHGFSILWIPLLLLTWALAGLSVVGMPLCGAIAVAQIRRVPEKFYGLRLALFDVLFYPLLLLNAAVIGLSLAGFKNMPLSEDVGNILLVLALMVSLDILVYWLAWKKLRIPKRQQGGPASAKPSVSAVPTVKSEPSAGAGGPRTAAINGLGIGGAPGESPG